MSDATREGAQHPHAAGRPGAGWGAAAGALAGLLAAELGLPGLVSWWSDRSLLVAVCALAGAVAWRLGWRRALAAALASLVAAWLVVLYSPLTAWLQAGLVRNDPLRRADAVCVLSSRMQEDAEPTDVALTRLLGGVELLAAGWSERLVISELAPPMAESAPYARGLLARLGIHAEVISVGPVGRTRDEAVAVARLFDQRGFRRVILVTSPVHSRRAAETFEHAGLEVVSVPSIETRFDGQRLERPGERLIAFGAVLHERVGLAYYRARGWIDP